MKMSKKFRKGFVRKGMAALMTAGLATATSNAVLAQEKWTTQPTDVLQKVAPTKMVQLNSTNLGKLGNNLFVSNTERQKFLADPLAYTESLLGGKIDEVNKRDLMQLQLLMANGLCCMGCGCGNPETSVNVLPAKQ
jgi:hypothetical protein